MSYAKQLNIFQDGVMGKDKPAAIKLIKKARHNEFTPDMRLGVYANAYRIRLVEATEVDYPALKHHIGEEAFDALMQNYVEANPSRLWDLNRYPIAFAEYILKQTDDEFAHAITKLEAAITEVFWMPESQPLASDYFAGRPEEEFAAAVLKPRAASRLVEFDYPVNNYLIAYRDGENPAAPAPEKQYIYLYRHNDKAMREVLDEGAFLLLQLLFAGKPVSAALEELTTTRPDLAGPVAQNLAGWFQYWFEHGFFTEYCVS